MNPKEKALHELESLITQLDSTITSEKSKAALKLSQAKIFPELISDPDQFLHGFVIKFLNHFSVTTEACRNSCVECVKNSVEALGSTNLQLTLNYIITPLFHQIEIEQAEHIALNLIKLLQIIIEMITPETTPNNFDQYIPQMIKPIVISLSAEDPNMKRLATSVLNSTLKKCSANILRPILEPILKVLLTNAMHRQAETRHVSLDCLATLYVCSGFTQGFDNIITILDRLAFDSMGVVRKSVIRFCETILTQHSYRTSLYYPLMLPLFCLLTRIVPLRQIAPNQEIIKEKPNKKMEESEMAFKALNNIGQNYLDTIPDPIPVETLQFDENHIINTGLKKIIEDNFQKFSNDLLPKLTDWTETTRKFGFNAMRSLIQLAQGHCSRYANPIYLRLITSIRDNKKDNYDALQACAALANYIPDLDIVAVLAPKITEDGPAEVLSLLSVSMINRRFGDGELNLILEDLLSSRVDLSLKNINLTSQLLLAMISTSEEFAMTNAVGLLTFILRLCEHSDALSFFENAFPKPLSVMFGDHISFILKFAMTPETTPMFLRNLLTLSQIEPLQRHQQEIHACLAYAYENNQNYEINSPEISSRALLNSLVKDLAMQKRLLNVDNQFLEFIFKDLEWRSDPSFIPVRREAACALAALLKENAILNLDSQAVLPPILTAIGDMTNQDTNGIRIAGIEALGALLDLCPTLYSNFEQIYHALKERVNEHCIDVRVAATSVLEKFLLSCVKTNIEKTVEEKWNELFFFLDDPEKRISEAMCHLAITIGKVPCWTKSVLDTVEQQIKVASGNEAREFYQRVIDALH